MMEEAVAGADAVLNALGHTKTSAKNVQTAGTKNIVAAMQRHGVRRIVSETGAGVSDPTDEPHLGAQLMRGVMDGPRTDTYREGRLKLGPTAKISRADVADFNVARGYRREPLS